MAKVIQNEHNVVVEPWWVKEKIIYIGLGLGALWWALTALLDRYVVEPLACMNLSTANSCIESLDISGNVAVILVAVIGTILLVRYLQHRPIVISLTSAVILWGLAGLSAGLNWYISLFWAVVLYGLSYWLLSLVTRIRHIAVVLVLAIVIAVGIRVLLTL